MMLARGGGSECKAGGCGGRGYSRAALRGRHG